MVTEAAVSMAPPAIESVLTVLRSLSIPGHWVRLVEEVSELEQEEQGQMLGDALPIGLRLLATKD